MFDLKDKKNKKIVEYIKSKNILVVDPTTTSRQTFRKVFKNFGVEVANLVAVENFNKALDEITSLRPHIILCQSQIKDQSFYQLLEEHLKLQPNRLDAFFIIVSPENSYAMSAAVLDNEVDAFIAAPFTGKIVEDAILSILKEKSEPSKALVEVEKLKSHYFKQNYKDLLEVPELIVKNKDLAPLAYYYSGAAFIEEDQINLAIEQFEKGIEINPEHYKCNRGLVEIYYKQRKYDQAYQIECKLCEKYPVSPGRLPNLIRLSLATSNFKDINNYREIFTNLKDQTDALKKYMAAGLAICGKYLIAEDNKEEAVKILLEAAEYSDGAISIIQTVVHTLLDQKRIKEVKIVLTKFVTESTPLEDRTILDFLLFSEENSISDTLNEGRKLINKGFASCDIYCVMLELSIKGGMKKDRVEDLYFEAKQALPDHLDSFDHIFSKID